MKQKDLALILVVAIVSAVFSLVISGAVFASAKNKRQTAQVVPVITSTFQAPSAKYFNAQSINPTQPIQIGTSSNTNAFNGSPQ